jgi:hypothetical protein
MTRVCTVEAPLTWVEKPWQIFFVSDRGDQTLSDTPLLRMADGTHGVIESVAREVAALLRCAVAVPHVPFGCS